MNPLSSGGIMPSDNDINMELLLQVCTVLFLLIFCKGHAAQIIAGIFLLILQYRARGKLL